jgi:hypothetical protein
MIAVGWGRVDRTGRVNDDHIVEMLWRRRLSTPHPFILEPPSAAIWTIGSAVVCASSLNCLTGVA